MKKLDKKLLTNLGFNKDSILYFYKEVKKYVVNKPHIINDVDFHRVADNTFKKFPETNWGYSILYLVLFKPLFDKEKI